MGVEVWTEVLSEGLVAVWAWNGYSLGVFVHSMDGYHVNGSTMSAIGQYADDKEVNMTVNEMYDESGFDGSVEEFMQEVIGSA